MSWQFIAHMPALRLTEARPLAIAGGELAQLPFEEWLELDSSFEGMRNIYNRSLPIFFRKEIGDDEVAANSEWFSTVGTGLSADVHHAITLYTGIGTPPPGFSTHYLVRNGGATRLVGNAERELIFYNDVAIELGADDVEALAATFAIVDGRSKLLDQPPLSVALQSLWRTTLPNFEEIDAVVHSAIALEALLVNAATHTARGEVAARRCAALIGDEQTRGRWQDLVRLVFAVRNRALHGEDFSELVEAAGVDLATLAGTARYAVAQSVLQVMQRLRPTDDVRRALPKLWQELDDA